MNINQTPVVVLPVWTNTLCDILCDLGVLHG